MQAMILENLMVITGNINGAWVSGAGYGVGVRAHQFNPDPLHLGPDRDRIWNSSVQHLAFSQGVKEATIGNLAVDALITHDGQGDRRDWIAALIA